MNEIRAGYMGLADIDDLKIRCTSFTVTPSQDPIFYDHVIGLKDTVPTDASTKGENLAEDYANTQKRIWRPSPITIAGNMSFPATDNNLEPIFVLARYANYFDLGFTYYCGNGTSGTDARKFKNCRINEYSFSVTSGDIVNTSIGVSAKDQESLSFVEGYTVPQKLITWDQCPVTVSGAPFSVNKLHINGLNFKINNNIQNIYVVGDTSIPSNTSSLLPYDLRVGMQEVTGSLSVYLESGYEYIPIGIANPSVITVNLPSLKLSIDVIFKSQQMEGQVGPIITQLPFVGVDKVFTIL